ncbi:hypothetical protein D3C72_801920 [compost metagenome]
MEAGVGGAQVLDPARRGPGLVAPAVLRHGGKHEDLAAAVEREGHDLAGRLGPPPLGEGAEVGHAGQLLRRHHGAVGHHASENRVFLAQQRGADDGVDAVGADQHVHILSIAIGEAQRGAAPAVLRRDVGGLVCQPHAGARHGGFQRGHQVAPVHGQLRRAVALLGFVRHGQAGGFRAGVPGAADAVRGAGCRFAQRGADAQAVQCPHRVRREIDVRTNAREPRRLLVHHNIHAELAQGDGGGQSANAGTVDADLS